MNYIQKIMLMMVMVSLFQCKLNLCLGLKYKKLMVEQIMNTNKINILCQQEVDLEVGYCENSLSIPGYDLLIGKDYIKARSGIFISNRVNYTRKSNLEGVDSHIVIIDIEAISLFFH